LGTVISMSDLWGRRGTGGGGVRGNNNTRPLRSIDERQARIAARKAQAQKQRTAGRHTSSTVAFVDAVGAKMQADFARFIESRIEANERPDLDFMVNWHLAEMEGNEDE
jgi:hypothetical protein